MDERLRYVAAAIALAHSNERNIRSVYSYTDSKYYSVDVKIDDDRVKGFDYTENHHFDGRMPNLYHYGMSNHFQFKNKGDGRYSGFDYSKNCHFGVTVRSKSADLYDYGVGSYFSFSL
ncbi:MAG: hypothetical protein R3B69_02890 [Candidatus Paceibacterota bacterium]